MLQFVSKVDICEPKQISCVEKIALTNNECQRPCQGLYVTSIFKTPIDESEFSNVFEIFKRDYRTYKDQSYVASAENLGG